MSVLVVILIVVALVATIGAVIIMRRKPVAPDAAPPSPDTHTPAPAEPPPMSDLESALAQVTDSTGRPIGDRIDAETDHVDELRVPDDTGPLLRRALDHVAKPGAHNTENPSPNSDGDISPDEGDAPPAP